jgi:hypothetical protein
VYGRGFIHEGFQGWLMGDLSTHDFHVTLGMGGCLRKPNLNVVTQEGDKAKQPISGKSIEAASKQTGHPGLPETKDIASFGLGKTSMLDDP